MFSEKATASKRYEDTEVLIGEFMAHGPTEERTRQAIGRMNSLHSPFIKAGKISNEDLLYTLALFISEPVRFIEMLEWRHITKMELCALATFWKSIGDAMSIQYTGYLKQNSWKDGLEFAKDIIEWAQQYEEEYMRPAASNCKTANELTPLLLFYLPSPFVGFARSVMGVIMGERLREAMM